MKARDRERAAALRMVVDVLQQDAKLGKGDEVAVLQRERKKRVEAAEAYEGAGRAEQAAAERFEAELIEGYLPQQLSDEELEELVDEAVAETGASEQQADGPGDVGADAEARRPRRRQAGQRRGAAEAGCLSLARRQLTLDNTVAAELAGSEDTVLRGLRGRPRRDLHLRGNVLTLDGDPDDVAGGGDRGRRDGRADRARPRRRARDDRSGRPARSTPKRARRRSSTTSSGATATPKWRRRR